MNFIEFYDHHVPALEADEARHHMLLHGLMHVARRPLREFRGWNLGAAGACAIQPNRDWAVLLGDVTQEQAVALADDLADSDFPGVMGPGEGPDWFASQATQLGIPMKEPLRHLIHVLDEPPPIPAIEGMARTATVDDAALFGEWKCAYVREELPHEPVPEDSDFARWVGQGGYLFWVVDGQPVSMAGIAGETNNGAAVVGVYTPPALRGRGYARGVLAAAARRIRQEGRDRVFLMARTENAPALRCYARLGFRPVADFTHYWRKYA
jgi:RimJ/RimL family protein N-acetyltransferase